MIMSWQLHSVVAVVIAVATMYMFFIIQKEMCLHFFMI